MEGVNIESNRWKRETNGIIERKINKSADETNSHAVSSPRDSRVENEKKRNKI
jgi:hypothetical protein